MKKFFTLVAMATMALAANAQQESAFIDATTLLGEGAKETAVKVAAGTEVCASASVSMKAAYECDYKIVSMSGESDPFKSITIDGTAYENVVAGIQGQSNPTNTKNATTQTPKDNAIFQFDVTKDGYLYVISKLSANKQYYVFEGSSSQMAYDVVFGYLGDSQKYDAHMPSDAMGYVDYSKDATYPFTTIGTYFLCDLVNMRPSSDANYGTATFVDAHKKNGLGVIGFPVYAEAKTYYVFAVGSKVTCDGFVFVPNAEEIGVVDITESATGINNVAVENAAAPVKKVAKNGQIMIGNYNIAGQLVK